MTIENIISSFVLLLLLALLSKLLSHLTRLPLATCLVIVGFVASELLVLSGIDTGIRADNFQQLIFYVLLPILVFESAYLIDKKLLKHNLLTIIFLSTFGVLLTSSLIAAGLYYGIAHASGFPWVAALLTGAILAATDPASVVSALKSIGAPRRLALLLEGESLFNDAMAIVLFSVILSIATTVSIEIEPLTVVYEYIKVFLGGVVTGLIIGMLAVKVSSILDQKSMVVLLSIVVAYGSFLIAEKLTVSGVMATLTAAIILSVKERRESHSVFNENFWAVIGEIASVIVFIVMGVTITAGMFEQRWLAMMLAVVSVLAARMFIVYVGLFLISKLITEDIDIKEKTVMVWGGLRGAVTLALALSLPTTLEYWWTIQSIAFGVVVFTLFVQAPTMKILIRVLGFKND